MTLRISGGTELKPPQGHAALTGMDRILGAASRGDLDAVRTWLEAHPESVNAFNAGHNRTLLWEATRRNRRDLVEHLIARGADVNIPGRYRHESFVLLTPYCVARAFRREELADYLLEKGARLDVYSAAYLGDASRVFRLLDADPTLINREHPLDSVWRVTPLHFAVSGCQMEIADELTRRGAKVKPHARLLLDIAGRKKRIDFVEMLLNAGADPREMPVGSALRDESFAILSLVIERGLNVNRRSRHDLWHPIAYLSRSDKDEHPERIQALIDAGADVNVRSPKGQTALHAASRAGFSEVIQRLLEAGAQVNARTIDGITPLTVATRARHAGAVHLLRSNGGVA